MAKKRVLFLLSIDDDEMKKRYKLMVKSLRLKDYTIEFFFILLSLGEPIKASKFFGRIKKAIKDFRPEILFLHKGIAFQKNPQAIIDAFIELKKIYPSLKFGIERRPSIFEDIISESLKTPEILEEIFEDSEEMRIFNDFF